MPPGLSAPRRCTSWCSRQPSEPDSTSPSLLTRSAIAGPHICLRTALICGRFNFCSDTLIWSTQPSTCTYRNATCKRLPTGRIDRGCRPRRRQPLPTPAAIVNRPTLEVADIFQSRGDSFIEQNQTRISYQQLKVMRAIIRCRTAALGGHIDRCTRCGHQAISYNSCRNRHCPKCQAQARQRWLADRERELLPTRYVHVVFTLPGELSSLILRNQRVLYDLLFAASASTLLEVAADPKRLGAEIGFFGILHTWGQNLLHHSHVHYVIPAGGLDPDRSRWVHPRYPFFLPVRILSRVFRGKFFAGLRRAFRRGRLDFGGKLRHLAEPKCFASFLRTLFRKECGSFMPSRPSVDLSKCFAILAVTHTGWRSRTTASWRSMGSRSPSAGAIMLAATNSAR